MRETPGSVQTLVLEEESEILFIIQGALEYVDRDGHTLAHEDCGPLLRNIGISAPPVVSACLT